MKTGLVHLQMQDVSLIKTFDNHLFLNTGSPHHVQWESGLDTLNVKSKGSKKRIWSHPSMEPGRNGNFGKKNFQQIILQ